MKNWSPTPVTVSVLNAGIDADLNLGAIYKLKTDHIAESTGAHGIVTDNLLAPAVGATLAAGQVLKTDHIAETTGAHGIVTDNLLAPAVGATLAAGQVLKTDHIAESTGAHGIVTDNLLAPAVGATIAAGQVLKSDHIAETTGAHGIVHDNVVKTDHIAETTGAHGIVTDNLLAPAVGATLAAGQVLKTDHIGETTGAHGVTLDNATSTHHQLTGLTDDDHARYFDKDASKAFTGSTLSRNTDDTLMSIWGGLLATSSCGAITMRGADHVTMPGSINIYVANAAKTGFHEAMRLLGVTDTPYLDMLSHRITSVTDPTSAQDAATKNYIDVRLPSGVIMNWSGAIVAIPAGWVLCNGGAGTPDLRDMFVVGAGTTYAVGATGGEATHVLTEAELAIHHHTYVKTNFSANTGGTTAAGYVSPGAVDTGDAGSNTAHENRPPYYALAYIMKT
jgi:hypothetical protein